MIDSIYSSSITLHASAQKVGGGPSGFLLTLWRKDQAPSAVFVVLFLRQTFVEMILYNAKESEIAFFSGFGKKFHFFWTMVVNLLGKIIMLLGGFKFK